MYYLCTTYVSPMGYLSTLPFDAALVAGYGTGPALGNGYVHGAPWAAPASPPYGIGIRLVCAHAASPTYGIGTSLVRAHAASPPHGVGIRLVRPRACASSAWAELPKSIDRNRVDDRGGCACSFITHVQRIYYDQEAPSKRGPPTYFETRERE